MPLVVHGSENWPPSARGVAVAIGNFDGVHAGHRAVLERLRSLAARLGVASAAYTFEPAPTAVLAPQRHQPRILLVEDRVMLLGEAGAERVCVEPFTREYAAGPAEWFAREVLERRLGARAVVVGWDFRFGSGRAGTVDDLRRLLPAVEVVAIDAATDGGEPISSSRIRKLIAAGEVETAARLLGRPHRLRGIVVHGDHRGRTLGFPTANVDNQVELVPAPGVYAVRVGVDEGPARLPGVMNLGSRPTFDGAGVRVEVHLLEGGGDLYGHALRVDVVARLRAERRFEGVDALRAQIRADVAAARERLG